MTSDTNLLPKFSSEKILTFFKAPLTIALILIVLLLVVGEVLSPGFASADQIMRLLIVAALLGIVAAGQNLVILGGGGGIDLSVGGIVSLSAVLAGNIMDGSNIHIPLAILGCIMVGALIGLFNGIGIALLRIPPLVMTLGMLGVLQGLLIVIRNGIPSGRAATALSDFVVHPFIFGVSGILWLWLLIGLLMAFLLQRTVLGSRIYAVGANETTAFMVGVPVKTIRIAVYILCGVFASLAGVCLLGYSGSSFSNVGEQYMLPSIIAVVLGGTPLSGGKGAYTGTMAGAVLLTVLQSILTTLNIDEAGRQVVFGMTLLILMLFYGRGRAMRG